MNFPDSQKSARSDLNSTWTGIHYLKIQQKQAKYQECEDFRAKYQHFEDFLDFPLSDTFSAKIKC